LTTPEGWARANLLLQTLQAPPQPGSLREWVLILLVNRLEDIEHARFRALAQLIVDKETGVKAFEDYMKIAFPGMEARKKAQEQEVFDALKREVGRGPLKVTPLSTPKVRSKIQQQLVTAKRADAAVQERYKKADVSPWKLAR